MGYRADALILKYSVRDTLSQEERAVLEGAIADVREIGPDQDLVREGSRPTASTLLLEGYTIRYHILADGKRQISAVHITGDFLDLHSFLIRKMDHNVATLSPCRVAMVPHVALREITEKYPHLTRILWLSTLIDAAIHREWVVSMGRRSAVARLAHLACELYVRLQQVERTDGPSFHFPVTQIELGDLLGLSVVHVNRSLQDLRASGALSWHDERVRVLDWDRLKQIAEFDDNYLHLHHEPR